MANTTAFGWDTPDDTDLVKDGAAAIRELGQDIDTSMADLLGGTTGQVLSKASGTNMDFTWVTPDDTNAIQNAIIDAKGDLIVGASADTPARLPIGSNGYVLTADSAETYGVKWAAASGGGGMTLINTGGTALSGSSVTVSSIPNTYKALKIIVRGFKPDSNDKVIKINFNSDTSTAYQRVIVNNAASTGTTFGNTYFYGNINGISNATDAQYNQLCMDIPDYASTTTYKVVESTSLLKYAYANATVDWNFEKLWGGYASTSAISSITFGINSGNWSAGTIYVYGVS